MKESYIKKLQEEADQTLEMTIRELYPKIYTYIYRRVLDETRAKDLCQETFYRFFTYIDNYQHQDKLLNYLYLIARNLIYDASTKSTVEFELVEEEIMVDQTPHQEVIKKEENYFLRKWVYQLPSHLQEVILLRYEENLKFKDISKITGVNVSTVKSRLKLAISLLQQKEKEVRLR